MSAVLNNNGIEKTLGNGIVLNSVFYPGDVLLPNIIENRNLLDVTETSNPKDCFNALKSIDPTKLRLGDYIDIPKWDVVGTTTTTEPFRFQIAGFNHYGSDSGILFESVNIPFKRVMMDREPETNFAGYEGSDLRKLINNTFAPKLKEYTGPLKSISRVLDKNQCKEYSTVVDEVYIMNYTELFGDQSFQCYIGDGATESRKNSKQFQIHSAGGVDSRIKKFNGIPNPYWTSSTSSCGKQYFCGCYKDGSTIDPYINSINSTILCFNIENTYGTVDDTPPVIPYPDIYNTISNRNLLEVTGTSTPEACFEALRTINPTKLRLGDYIDITKWTVNGAEVTTTDDNFRFQIAGFNHYGPDSGILFESVNIPFQRAMTDSGTNAAGYEGSDLRKLINNTFKPELEKRIGLTKSITRYLDKDQCKSGNFVTDSVYVPNYTELFGNEYPEDFNPNYTYAGPGADESRKNSKQFQIHSIGGKDSRIKKYNGSAWGYWASSTSQDYTGAFCYCNTHGNSNRGYNASASSSVVVCFNIENTYPYKPIPDTIENRNLLDVTKTLAPGACFTALRSIDPTKLRLGDYIDIPKWDVKDPEVIATTSDPYFRFQIAGFNHYGSDSGILFESVNIPFQRAMTDDGMNTVGYEGSELRKLLQGSFKNLLKYTTGITKSVERYLDKDQCKSGNFIVDEVYVPNYTELFGYSTTPYYSGPGATMSEQHSKQFQIHAVGGNESTIKNFDGSPWFYWAASSSSNGDEHFCSSNLKGLPSCDTSDGSTDMGVIVCFNIENTYKPEPRSKIDPSQFPPILREEGVCKGNISSVFYESSSTSDNTEATNKILIDTTGVIVKKANKGPTLSQIYWWPYIL